MITIRIDVKVPIKNNEEVIKTIIRALEWTEKKIKEGWHLSAFDVVVAIDEELMKIGKEGMRCSHWLWLTKEGIDIDVYADDEKIWITVEECEDERLCDCSE